MSWRSKQKAGLVASAQRSDRREVDEFQSPKSGEFVVLSDQPWDSMSLDMPTEELGRFKSQLRKISGVSGRHSNLRDALLTGRAMSLAELSALQVRMGLPELED